MDWNIVLQGLIVALLIGGVGGIFSMNTKLSKMNGSIRELTVWKTDHNKQDDERHEKTLIDMRDLWEAIKK